MKAYWVQQKDADWGMFIHADTSNKAKVRYMSKDPDLYGAEYIYLRTYRCKNLDDVPFLLSEMGKYNYYFEDMRENDWIEWCNCELCRGITE